MNPTTASYIAKSFAHDRRVEAARDRRLVACRRTRVEAGLASPDPRRGTANPRHLGFRSAAARVVASLIHVGSHA